MSALASLGGTSTNGAGALAVALANAGQTQRGIADLTAQTSSGFISSDYAGLGAGARASLDLGGQLALNTRAQATAAQAADVNQVAQTALGQIQTLTANLSSQLLGAATGSNTGLATIAANARDALGQVAELLNTKVGQVYVFAGQDSRNPPIPNAGGITQSAFYAAIQSAVATLPGSPATTVQAQALAAAGPGATSPFSASLEASGAVSTASLGGGQTVQLAVLANQNSDAVSAGTPTSSTGSYIRDVLSAFATLGALGTANATDPQTQALVGLVHTTLSGADDALNTDIGALGVRQDTVKAAQSDLTDTATALTTQLGATRDADTATVATELSAAQTRLQASYKVIGDLAQLSLVKFL